MVIGHAAWRLTRNEARRRLRQDRAVAGDEEGCEHGPIALERRIAFEFVRESALQAKGDRSRTSHQCWRVRDGSEEGHRPGIHAGIAITGTVLAALFGGNIATSNWSTQQTAEFREAVTIAGLTLTVVAGVLVGWGIARSRRGVNGQLP